MNEKRQFMEGAVWMGRRICNEVERVCQSFDTLQTEYHKRYLNAKKVSEAEMQRAQTWLLEAIK